MVTGCQARLPTQGKGNTAIARWSPRQSSGRAADRRAVGYPAGSPSAIRSLDAPDRLNISACIDGDVLTFAAPESLIIGVFADQSRKSDCKLSFRRAGLPNPASYLPLSSSASTYEASRRKIPVNIWYHCPNKP